jgi:type I restriction enzyme S subunit
MKTPWQTKELGEVCDFYNGLWKGKEPPYINVGVIRNTNITKDGSLNDSDIAYLDVEKKQFAKRKLNYGDIILEKSGGGPKQPVGRVIVFDKTEGDFSFSNFTSAIRVKDQSVLDFHFLHKFLFYSYISGITEGMQSHSTGIRNLDLHAYKEIEAPLPPLAEQKRIVKMLDDVFEQVTKAKENAEKNLQNAKELFESYLNAVFAKFDKKTPSVPILDVGEVFDGPHATPKTIDSGPIFLGISALDNGRINLDKTRHVSTKDFIQWTRRVKPKTDDVVFSYETRLGQAGIIPEGLECCLGRRMGLVRLNVERIYPKFFLYQYISNPFQLFLKSKTVKGATVDRISVKEFPSFLIKVPTLSEQKTILKKLDALLVYTKRLEEIYEQKLADLEELKKSILKKAFSGKLTLVAEKIENSVHVPSPYVRNQVHAAIIDQVTKDGGWTTEVAVAKYDHLLQEVYGLALGYQFADSTFGPFDAQIKKLVSSGLGRNHWFTKRRGMLVFGDNASELLSRQSNLYRNAKAVMQELSQLGITKMDADRVELLATICHSIKKTGSDTFEEVRAYMAKWPTDNDRTKAEKFAEEQTRKCLEFISRNGLQRRLLQTI